MTPKKKAKAIFNKYFIISGFFSDARESSLIYVNGMIDFIELCGDNFNWCYTGERIRTPLEYWQEVKQEIEKL